MSRIDDQGPLPHQVSTHRYSILRALRSHIDKEARNDGLEAETSQEIARRLGRPTRGCFVPLDARLNPRDGFERRDLTTTSGAGAVADRYAGAETLIDVLRAKSLIASLGAWMPRVPPGKYAVPKKGAAATTYWLPEDGSMGSDDGPGIGQLVFQPKIVGGYTDISLKLIRTGPDAERLVVDELMGAVGAAIDRAAFRGEGDDEPLGMLNDGSFPTLDIGADGAPPTRRVLVDLEKAVGNANAEVEGANLAYVTTPDGRAALRMAEKVAGSGRYLWDDDNRLNGYSAHATTQLPNDLTKGEGEGLSPLVFGNWRDVAMPMWGAVEILVNPYLFSIQGFVRLTVMQGVDFKARHPESFIIARDMVTA